MTGEELSRTITFILEQQAQITSNQAQVTSNMAQLTERVNRMAEKVDRNAESITALLAIAEMHEREITENREAQSRTDERLNALIDTVERYISEGRNGKA